MCNCWEPLFQYFKKLFPLAKKPALSCASVKIISLNVSVLLNVLFPPPGEMEGLGYGSTVGYLPTTPRAGVGSWLKSSAPA